MVKRTIQRELERIESNIEVATMEHVAVLELVIIMIRMIMAIVDSKGSSSCPRLQRAYEKISPNAHPEREENKEVPVGITFIALVKRPLTIIAMVVKRACLVRGEGGLILSLVSPWTKVSYI